MNNEFPNLLEAICERDPRYKQGAYEFVMEALSYAQKKFGRVRHVNGEELLEGIRELLLNQFGPMAMTVLKYWGITSTEDFGNIVFHLVENRILSKTDEDNIESFKNGYDFDEVFGNGYRQILAKKLSRMKSI